MVRLVLPVMLVLEVSWRGRAAALIKGFQPERKPIRQWKAAGIKTRCGFLIMFAL
jgi:hypothetical protein